MHKLSTRMHLERSLPRGRRSQLVVDQLIRQRWSSWRNRGELHPKGRETIHQKCISRTGPILGLQRLRRLSSGQTVLDWHGLVGFRDLSMCLWQVDIEASDAARKRSFSVRFDSSDSSSVVVRNSAIGGSPVRVVTLHLGGIVAQHLEAEVFLFLFA